MKNKNPEIKKRHGSHDNPLYGAVYLSMINRCYNPNNKSYHRYGARNIKVSDTWLNSFSIFLKDTGERPFGYQLDRIDNNGDYSKENCRWATRYQQASNRENNLKHIGVRWESNRNKYLVRVKISNVDVNLGRYSDLKDALFSRSLGLELAQLI